MSDIKKELKEMIGKIMEELEVEKEQMKIDEKEKKVEKLVTRRCGVLYLELEKRRVTIVKMKEIIERWVSYYNKFDSTEKLNKESSIFGIDPMIKMIFLIDNQEGYAIEKDCKILLRSNIYAGCEAVKEG